jgi:hypothetical protein
MSLYEILHLIGAGVLLAYAIACIIRPQWAAAWLEFELNTGRASAEFRILHGYLLGLAVFALYSQNPLLFQALGWGWLGAALLRLLSYLLDRPKLNATYFAYLAMEITLGIFLLV